MGTRFSKTFLDPTAKTPEKKLWQGVLVNAIDDCCQMSQDRKTSIYKAEAYSWILDYSKDFKIVCYFGGFDPLSVKADFERAVKRGDVLFSEKQIAWSKYYRQFLIYKRNTHHESRPYHRKRMEHLRAHVERASSTTFISMVTVSLLA
tara:strand:+ start:2809 stop:3252 length:444 start_codon:yes stop_codon:yes gene_type:complete